MNETTLLFATYLASADYKLYQYVTEYIEKFTGIPSILLNGEALDDFALGFIDAGFLAASDYAYLADQTPSPVERLAIPVLSNAVSDRERAISSKGKMKVMVRKEQPCCEVAELQDGVFSYCARGYAEDEGETMHQLVGQILQACNVCPLMGAPKMLAACSSMQALRMVLHGEADAAIVEASVLNLVLRNNIGLARGLREVCMHTVAKATDVVVSVRLDEQVKQALREAFRTIHQEPFFAQRLREGSIEQFLVTEPERVVGQLDADRELVNADADHLEQIYACSL